MSKYIWRFAKSENNSQESVSMYDMSLEQLEKAKKHCNLICNNKHKDKLGQRLILNEVELQYENCCTQQALKHILSLEQDGVKLISRRLLMSSISDAFQSGMDRSTAIASDLFVGLPLDFQNIKLDKLLDASLDRLGVFDKKYIGKGFISRVGIWLTREEFKDMGVYTRSEIIEYIKSDLKLQPNYKVVIRPDGMSYADFKLLMSIPPTIKYSDLKHDELELLSNSILPILISRFKNNIEKWESLESELKEVIESKKQSK